MICTYLNSLDMRSCDGTTRGSKGVSLPTYALNVRARFHIAVRLYDPNLVDVPPPPPLPAYILGITNAMAYVYMRVAN